MIPLEGLKVITAQEMARIENLAYSEGASDSLFMENAGSAVANIVEMHILTFDLNKHVTLLTGKGNNAGDAYVAGTALLQKGFTVVAFQLYPMESSSPLCKKNYEKFKKAGGLVHFFSEDDEIVFEEKGVILDGIVGTGFRGKAEGIMEKAILAANESFLPIFAIDIPSGVNGDTGEVETVAIHAYVTIYLGLPKWGFFVEKGWDHVGHLVFADYGMDKKFVDLAKPKAYLYNEEMLPFLLPPIRRSRHKYEAGYIVAMGGSPGMSGAAIMSSFASLRSGAGIIRLFHPKEMETEMSKSPFEVIREGWDLKNFTKLFQECKRASAMMIGPGIGRADKTKKALKAILAKTTLPCVIDADALYFLAENPSWKIPKNSVLTPHKGEMERFLPKAKSKKEFHAVCQDFAEKKKLTLVLKGAPTFIFHPGSIPIIVPRGDPGMATAGTGDVLTGVIGGLLAQKLPPRSAAVIGVALHALAGEYAAFEKTSYCMVASDLIDALPHVFSQLLAEAEEAFE